MGQLIFQPSGTLPQLVSWFLCPVVWSPALLAPPVGQLGNWERQALPCLSLGQVPLSKAGSLARQPNTEGPCGLDWNIFPQKRSQAGRCSGEGVGILETVQLSVAAFDSKDVLRRKGLLS